MTVTADQVRTVLAEADRLYTAAEVDAALDRMAARITQSLGDRNPIVLCVMTGGLVPAGQLITRLDFPLQLDYLHATRYRGDTRGGTLHWITRPTFDLKGRSVLVVDDILDEGLTLSAILDFCREQGAREVYSAVLVDKHHDRRPEPIHADFVGVEVGDRYVFGYGMDYKGYLRNAAGIFAVRGL
ncbi:MAG: hypoxanthine-guanine phosphoribosyltransferase [Gammaproteobacteria bacterium]|jgi:hypoxanthine phosphoribosyltransferase